MGANMKIVSIIAALLGTAVVLSAAVEGVTAFHQGQLGPAYLGAVVLVAVAAVLLTAAGIAAMRDTSSMQRIAMRAALASVVVFLLARVTFGWMSGALQLVGVVLPLVMLGLLYRRRPRHEVA